MGESRLDNLDKQPLDPKSLVGSYLLATARLGWQGCVVAEPARGVYLVELFSWAFGGSLDQKLVRLEDMTEWSFFDTSDWLSNAYRNFKQAQWDREREEQAA
jgi:hypothetical protein